MSAGIYKINATGAVAIAASATVPAGKTYRLQSVSCKFSAAPVTSESFTVTLNANAGAAYDTVLYSVDPSATSAASIYWLPSGKSLLEGSDSVDVAFTNTDTRTYGVQITLEEMT